MEIKPVKKPILYNKIQIYMLECLLNENKDINISENEKLLEYIKKYSKSFRDLWLKYEND